MRRISYQRVIGAVLVFAMLSVTTTYAGTTQDYIDDAKEQINDLKEQKEDAKKEIDHISDKKEGLESDLSKLNVQLSDIVAAMNEVEADMEQKESEIAQAEEALASAQLQCEQQYEAMKLRIQYMYENSSTSAWQTLLASSSISDFINRTEYITEINKYDRKMLTEYQDLQQQIEAQKQELETERQYLLALREENQKNKEQVNSLIESTKQNIVQADEALSDAQSDVEELDAQIAQMVEYERKLEIQKAKEDAARLAAIKQQEQEDTSGVAYVAADSDAYLLGAIIQCESGGEPYAGKLAVGSVIMNRVKSSYFPGTVSGVIYQSGQFSPVASGRLAYRLQTGVSSECMQAAQEVLNGNITVNCLYFRANNGIIQGIVIGNHVFY